MPTERPVQPIAHGADQILDVIAGTEVATAIGNTAIGNTANGKKLPTRKTSIIKASTRKSQSLMTAKPKPYNNKVKAV